MAHTENVERSLIRTLTTVGAASTAAGTVLARRSVTPAWRAFGQQTAAWGAVDLAISSVAGRRASPLGPRLRRILLVNAGLDVGYVAAGIYLAHRTPDLGGRLTAGQARGHGFAVVVQGALLLALDLSHAQQLAPR